jgi:PhnB protein
MAKKKVRPVPKGYHTVTPGLAVQGADTFIRFCKKAFGAKEVMRMPGPGGAVMHAELLIGNSHVMVNDEMPGMGNKSATSLGGSPATLYIYVEKCDAVFKKAVAAGAMIKMPMENMFWGDRMGVVVDPFGNTWSIASRIEDMSPREMKKRGEAWMKQMARQAPGA